MCCLILLDDDDVVPVLVWWCVLGCECEDTNSDSRPHRINAYIVCVGTLEIRGIGGHRFGVCVWQKASTGVDMVLMRVCVHV